MPDVPYPLSDANPEELKQKVWELIRVLYEEKMAGLDVGDVFKDDAGMLTLKLYSTGGLKKTSGELGIKLDGTSLRLSTDGIKVGQSSHIDNPSGGDYVDAQSRAAINSILSLLEERGLMASS
jgi:hypothetical protein